MVDGILDLLTAILVLGIVVAIAFGFIIPLVNGDVMQYDADYEDKAVLNNVVEYDDLDTYEDVLQRKYTYPELVLFMYVQDTRMGEPNKIDLKGVNDGADTNTVYDSSIGGLGENYTVTVQEGDNKNNVSYDETVNDLQVYMLNRSKVRRIVRDLKETDTGAFQKKYSIHYQYEVPGEEEERYMVHTKDSFEEWEEHMIDLKR